MKTKRNVRAVISLLLVMIMTLTLGMTVLAEGAYTLTLKDTREGHTYEVYQIFQGDLAQKDGQLVLSNIEWGQGVTYNGGLASAEAVAEALAAGTLTPDALTGQLTLTSPVKTVASSAMTTQITDLASGYYLVKDKDGSAPGTDAYTENIIQIVGDTQVNIKSDVPTVEKKVEDNAPARTWQDSADYSIGDTIPYQITGTVAGNVASYQAYAYRFTDTMSKGLTYTPGTARITIGGTDVTGSFTEHVSNGADGATIVTWSVDDLKSIAGVAVTADTKVVVAYSVRLNENAVVGAAGNPNTVKLTFSNNPNQGGEGSRGETPEDKNIVFTYKVVVNKTDGSRPLTGAGFTLLKKAEDGSYVTIGGELKGESMTVFTWSGLGDGDYKLSETTTPAGYNTIKDVEFMISATHDAEADNPSLVSVSGVSAQGELTFTSDNSAGSLATEVINKAGVILPSTGGAGTTLIYILGGILVLGSGIVLALRRKLK